MMAKLKVRAVFSISLLMICSIVLGDTSRSLTLKIQVLDALSKLPVTGVHAKLLRDFPNLKVGSDLISYNTLSPWTFFSIINLEDQVTTQARIVGSNALEFSTESSEITASIPHEYVAGTENLWIEISRDGYYSTMRSLGVAVPDIAAGLQITRTLLIAPRVHKVTDAETTQTIREHGIEILVPPKSLPKGQEIFVDIQPQMSATQYLSNFPSMYTYPVIISPVNAELRTPLVVRYLPEMFKGMSDPLVFKLARISTQDYSLNKLYDVWPNGKKSFEPPFTYEVLISRGGLYALVN